MKFLETYNIPSSLYWNLYADDKELTTEIYAGVRYYTLVEDNTLLQALIPLNDNTQIHVFKDESEECGYKIDFIPIKYFSYNNSIAIVIQKSPYQDLVELTGDKSLANEFVNVYKSSIDFNKNVLKNDKLVLIYNSKMRLGRNFGNPDIRASLIETNKKPNFLFAYSDGRYYNEKGNEIMTMFFRTPIQNARISSRFSLNRMHPILKVLRPHYGVDYAAPVGTNVSAAASGKVSFVGERVGYGKIVEISHSNGVKTLYAHLKSFNVKKGQNVKAGQIIAKSGNSGLSTGAHLHFGMYKNNKPVNPLSSIKTQRALSASQKAEFLEIIKLYENAIEFAMRDKFSDYTPSYFAKQ